MGLLIRATNTMLMATCFLGMNFVLMFLFGFMRNLPTILTATRRVLRELMIWSLRLYEPILRFIDPLIQFAFGLGFQNVYMRMAATCALSLTIISLVYLIVDWNITVLGVAISMFHGFITGLVWDEIENTGNLQVGESLE